MTDVLALKQFPTFGQQSVSSNTDYSSVIEKLKQSIPGTMKLKDIAGASIVLVDNENIVWSEGFGYTNLSQKVKVTGFLYDRRRRSSNFQKRTIVSW